MRLGNFHIYLIFLDLLNHLITVNLIACLTRPVVYSLELNMELPSAETGSVVSQSTSVAADEQDELSKRLATLRASTS